MKTTHSLKIALLSDSLGKGGAENQAVIVAKTLQEMGHTVEIILYHPVNHFEEYTTKNKIRVVCIEKTNARQFGRVQKLVEYLKNNSFDVLYNLKIPSSVWGLIASKQLNIPQVYAGARSCIQEPITTRVLLNQLSKSCNGWIVNSPGIKQFLISSFWIEPHKILVVPNGVESQRLHSELSREQARQKLQIPDGSVTIAMVANFHPIKNHFMFFEMAQIVLRKIPSAIFLLAGTGKETVVQEYKKRCMELGIEKSVLFLGNMDKVADLYQATDISVLTSDSEGLPNALVESSGAHIPCISTDNGGSSEVIIDRYTGFITPANHPQAMADRVLFLIENPEKRVEMGQRAHELIVAKFSTEALGERLNALFQRGLQ